jgi:response regulator RpfG family c-di-GMP phosphodiesterase
METVKINVLIIDDEEQILTTFKAFFRVYYNVFTAKNTDDAMQIINQEKIQVVLCDYNMPNKDGILFFSELLITHPHISRILITAYDDLKIAIDGVNIGSIYRYVQKPWIVDELKIIIDQSFEFYNLKSKNQSLMDRLLSNDRLLNILESKK